MFSHGGGSGNGERREETAIMHQEYVALFSFHSTMWASYSFHPPFMSVSSFVLITELISGRTGIQTFSGPNCVILLYVS